MSVNLVRSNERSGLSKLPGIIPCCVLGATRVRSGSQEVRKGCVCRIPPVEHRNLWPLHHTEAITHLPSVAPREDVL